MRPSYLLVPWPTTGTKSQVVKLDGNMLVGFVMPATIASTSLTFNMTSTLSVANQVTWYPVADSSATTISFTLTASTAKYYGFSQDQIAKFTGVEVFQMVAGSSEAANQAIYAILLPRPSH